MSSDHLSPAIHPATPDQRLPSSDRPARDKNRNERHLPPSPRHPADWSPSFYKKRRSRNKNRKSKPSRISFRPSSLNAEEHAKLLCTSTRTPDQLISTVSLQHPPRQVPATISTTAHYPPNHGHLYPSVPVLSDSNAPPFPPLGHHMPKFLPTDSLTSTVHSPPQMSSTHCRLTLSLGLTKEVSNQIRHWVGSTHPPTSSEGSLTFYATSDSGHPLPFAWIRGSFQEAHPH